MRSVDLDLRPVAYKGPPWRGTNAASALCPPPFISTGMRGTEALKIIGVSHTDIWVENKTRWVGNLSIRGRQWCTDACTVGDTIDNVIVTVQLKTVESFDTAVQSDLDRNHSILNRYKTGSYSLCRRDVYSSVVVSRQDEEAEVIPVEKWFSCNMDANSVSEVLKGHHSYQFVRACPQGINMRDGIPAAV